MEGFPQSNIESQEHIVSRRPATEVGREFSRKVHHAAFQDVVERQWGNFDEAEQDVFFNKSWTSDNHEILVSGGADGGYCSIQKFPDPIFINELVLSPEFQGSGIGTKVLEEAIDEANEKHIPVRLQVLKANKAQELYRKMDFKDTEETENHFVMEYRST
jgi:ribosomal protein S18 acetylase RimI-like enzyme